MVSEIILENKIFKRFRNTDYFVSNDGEVYSGWSKRKLKLLKRWINKIHFYYYVDIYLGKTQKHCFIHRMVYEVWVGEIPTELQVNHKNDIKTDNRVSNLYIGTQKQNIHDSIRNNHRQPCYDSNKKKVVLLDKKYNAKVSFDSVMDALKYVEQETGHRITNGCMSQLVKSRKRKWFDDRFNILCLESVTTNGDECSHVG